MSKKKKKKKSIQKFSHVNFESKVGLRKIIRKRRFNIDNSNSLLTLFEHNVIRNSNLLLTLFGHNIIRNSFIVFFKGLSAVRSAKCTQKLRKRFTFFSFLSFCSECSGSELRDTVHVCNATRCSGRITSSSGCSCNSGRRSLPRTTVSNDASGSKIAIEVE